MLAACRVGYLYSPPLSEERMTFARYVADLLGLQVEARQSPACRSWVNRDCVYAATRGFDLVILQEPTRLSWQRLFASLLTRQFVQRARSSVLVLRHPHYPVKHILLYLEGGEADSLAVEWVARLARSFQAVVTILAIIPPVPAMFHGLARMRSDLPEVMATDSRLGRSLRQAARQLQAEEAQSKLQLRQGDFEWEFRGAVAECNADLIAVTGEAPGRFERWLGSDPVASLLRWRKCPVLVVKPTST